jgi:hypothetical protein
MTSKRWSHFLWPFLIIGGFNMAFANDDINSNFAIQKKTTFPEMNLQAQKKIRLQVGKQRSELIQSALFKKYPSYQIIDSCIGSFSKLGATDVAIAALILETKKVIYVSAIEEDKQNLIEVKKSTFQFNEKDVIAKPIDLKCESITSIERIRKQFESIDVLNAANFSLEIKGQLDVLCVSDPETLQSFSCFSYSVANRTFLPIGGWFND